MYIACHDRIVDLIVKDISNNYSLGLLAKYNLKMLKKIKIIIIIIISRTNLKSLNFSHKVAKYEKKVNTGKFCKDKGS